MSSLIVVLVAAIVAVALLMLALGAKMLLHEEQEYRRPCANADPTTGRCTHCTCHKRLFNAKEEQP
ncbi:MAG: hypothetical protein IJU19_05830 [Bacteroidales bacterium]|nr:hypothetical protein [Bacteroidales bacterium]